MGVRCGLDMIELDRMERALSQHGESFKNKVFTSGEKAYCEARGKAALQSYAVRFCAKEAVAKALGTGIAKGVSLIDIEVVSGAEGKPSVVLHGEARRVFEAMGAKAMDISLTHSRDYAAAHAVILL